MPGVSAGDTGRRIIWRRSSGPVPARICNRLLKAPIPPTFDSLDQRLDQRAVMRETGKDKD
jgi:hypothetical protein